MENLNEQSRPITTGRPQNHIDKVSFICQRILARAHQNWNVIEPRVASARFIDGPLIADILTDTWDTRYDWEEKTYAPATWKFESSETNDPVPDDSGNSHNSDKAPITSSAFQREKMNSRKTEICTQDAVISTAKVSLQPKKRTSKKNKEPKDNSQNKHNPKTVSKSRNVSPPPTRRFSSRIRNISQITMR